MEDINRNTRTLIISFAFALMVMIPLRFVEVGQVDYSGAPQVLGDSIEFSEPKLEAPYVDIEKSDDCLSSEYVDKVVSFLDLKKDAKDVESFESRRCE